MIDDNLAERAGRLRSADRTTRRSSDPPGRRRWWPRYQHPAASARALAGISAAAGTIGLVEVIFSAAAAPVTTQVAPMVAPSGTALAVSTSATRPPSGAPPAPDPNAVAAIGGLPTAGATPAGANMPAATSGGGGAAPPSAGGSTASPPATSPPATTAPTAPRATTAPTT